MAVPVESLKNNDTGKTWKEEFSNIDKNIKGYDELLTKFKQYVSEQEYFGKFQEKQLDSYLKSLDNLYDHWDEINSKIKDLQKEMDSVGLSASEIQNIFNDISKTISTVGQRMSIMKAPVAQLAALAGNINRAYEIQDGFTEKAVRSDLRRIQTSRDLYDSVIKRYTGESLELDAIEKARQSAKARLSLSESEITVLEKKLQAEGRLNEAERTRLKDLRDINREASSAVELLSDKNIEAADRLVKLAKFNVDNRKAVVKKTPGLQLASGVLGKFAGILGLSDLQGEIKDIKESTLQKAGAARREIYENKVEPIESKQSELNKQIEAKRRELEVLKGTSGAQAAFTDIRSTQNATGTKRVREARFLIEEVQRYKDIAATVDPKSGIYEKATSYVNTIQAFRDLAKLEAQAQDNASKLVKAQGELDKVTKVATEGSLKAMVGAFKDAVGSGWMLAFVIGKALWNQFKAVDELGVKLQREIGTWAGAMASANSELISATDFLEQAYQISTQFHIDPISVFTPVELAKAAEFKNMSNLSAQEVATLAVRSKSVNQSVTAYNTSMKEGYNNVLKSTTSAVAFGSVQKEIANTSEAISLSLGDNPKKIAEAATAALSLGMTMKDIEGIAENLMNFESSIEHEMEAQLLTGKQMNLAKAREYALNNDIAGLSRELRNNGVDAVEFQSMTYIKQKSLAQALGMSRDQLAGMVRQQILGANATDEWKKKTLGLTDEEYRRVSAQEQWQKVREKFLQSLTPLLKPVLDILTAVAGVLRWITGGIGMIISYFQPVFDFFQKIHSWFQKLFADNDSKVVQFVKNVSKAGTGIVGMILTVGVAAGTLIKSFQAAKSAILGGAKAIHTAFTGAKTVIAGTGTAMGNLEKAFRGGSHSPEVYQRARRIKALQKSEASTVAQSVSGATGKGLRGVSRGVKGFSATKVLAGAAAMVLVAGALWILSKAMQEMQKVTEGTAYVNVVLGLGVLMGAVWGLGMIAEKATDKIAVAALAMALIGASLIPLVFVLNLMKGVDWKDYGIMALSIVTFFAEFMLIGAALAGPQAALLGIGVAAIVSIGAAMTTLGIGLKKLKAATADLDVKDLKSKIDGIADIFVRLGDKDFDLKSIRKFRRASRQLSKIGKSLSSVASIENISGITALTQALAKFVSVLDKLDVQKFNKLSKSKISAVARVGVESESVTGSYNAAVDTKAASEVRVERQQTAQKAVKLDVIESKMDTIIKAIVNSRPGWDWLKFDEEAAKSLPNWQRS